MLVASTPHLRIHRFYAHNTLRNYTYVLEESAKRRGWVVDPWDGEETWTWAQREGVRLLGVLNTHGHHDHMRGNEALASHGVEVVANFPGGEGWTSQAWAAPGHTQDHQVFFVRDGHEHHLFAGDTLFQAGVGNCKHGGDPATLWRSLQELRAKLDADTHLHVGHDYLERNLGFVLHVEPENAEAKRLLQASSGVPTFERPAHRWGQELRLNPFLRVGEPRVREVVEKETGPLASGAAGDEIVFKTLRRWRDQW